MNGESLESNVPDGFLFSRATMNVIPSEEFVSSPSPWKEADPKLKVPSITPFPDEELHYLGGELGPSDSVHIAHYSDWTVLVAKDQIDNDWAGMACRGIFRDLVSWREANGDLDVESFILMDSFETKELAASAAKGEIDRRALQQE